jgi:hypothetical protein
MVRSQTRQIVRKTLSQKNPSLERAGGVAQGVGLRCTGVAGGGGGKLNLKKTKQNKTEVFTFSDFNRLQKCFI